MLSDNKGSEFNPYLITNATELALLSAIVNKKDGFDEYHDTYNNPNVYFEIDSSLSILDMGNRGFEPIGSEENPFKANFYGNYVSIQNLYINKPYLDNIGLFGKVAETGSVNNLVVNANMVSGRNNVGMGIGSIEGTSATEFAQAFGVEVSGRLIGNTNVGGAIGKVGQNVYVKNLGTSIKNACVYMAYNNSVHGSMNVGGLVGYTESDVYSAYNYKSYVYGGSNTGGLVGYSTATIQDAYNNNGFVITNYQMVCNDADNTLAISNHYNIAGIVGYGTIVDNVYSATLTYTYSEYSGEIVGNGSEISVTDSFYEGSRLVRNGEASGTNSNSGIAGIGTSNAQSKNRADLIRMELYTNVGWDFYNTWAKPPQVGENDDMPILIYFYGSVLFVSVDPNDESNDGEILPYNPPIDYSGVTPIRWEEGAREIYVMPNTSSNPKKFLILSDRTTKKNSSMPTASVDADYHIKSITVDNVVELSTEDEDNNLIRYIYEYVANQTYRERKVVVVAFAVDMFRIYFDFKNTSGIDNTIADGTVENTGTSVAAGESQTFAYGTVISLNLITIPGYRFDRFEHHSTYTNTGDGSYAENKSITKQTQSIDNRYTFARNDETGQVAVSEVGITFTVLPSTCEHYYAVFIQQFYVDVTVVGLAMDRYPDTIMGHLYHTHNDVKRSDWDDDATIQFRAGDEFVSGWYDIGTIVSLNAVEHHDVPGYPEKVRFEFLGWRKVDFNTNVPETEYESTNHSYILTNLAVGLDINTKYYAEFQIRAFDVKILMNEDGYLNYNYYDDWTGVLVESSDATKIDGPKDRYILFNASFGTELTVVLQALVGPPTHYISYIKIHNLDTGAEMTGVLTANSDYTHTVDVDSLENSILIEVIFDPDLWTRGHFQAVIPNESNGIYYISTNSELAWVAYSAKTNPTFANGKTFVVTNDLDMLDYFWEPIGIENAITFNLFDGGDKIISNLHIKRYHGGTYNGHNDSNNYDNDYIGLFGIASGNIENVKLTNLKYTGTYTTGAVGGIIGRLTGGRVYECSATGIIEVVANSIGGIVGINDAMVRNSDNFAIIQNPVEPIYSDPYTENIVRNVGGIVGTNYDRVFYNRNNGGINVTGENVGGIIGTNYGTAEQNANEANITGSSNVGGIVGIMSEKSTYTSKPIKDSYNKGVITATLSDTSYAGAIVGYVFKCTSTTAIYTSYNVGSVIAGTRDATGNIYGSCALTIKDCYTYSTQTTSNATVLNNSQLTKESSFVGFNFNSPWTIKAGLNDGRPVLVLVETRDYHVATEIPADQISGNTYTIKTAGELAYLAKQVNTVAGFATGKTFIIEDNIDLFGSYITPIGISDAYSFTGTFIGNEKSLEYVTIVEDMSSLGLFAYTSNSSVIKDVNLDNAYVEQENSTNAYNLGIVAGTANGTISNVKVLRGYLRDTWINTASYTNRNVGGLVGQLNGSGILLQNKAQIVVSNGNIGGVVGKLTGKLEQSSSHNIANAVLYVDTITANVGTIGGLVGISVDNSIIENAYNTGNILVSNNTSIVGGIVGNATKTTIKYTYNIASVTGDDKYGSIIGMSSGNTLEYNYYLNDNEYGIATATDGFANDALGKLEKKSSAEMTISESYFGNERDDRAAIASVIYVTWDFGLIWAFVLDPAKPMYNNGYPVLIQMYDYNTMTITVDHYEQSADVTGIEKHGYVTTEFGYELGDKMYVIDDEDTMIRIWPHENSYIDTVTVTNASDPEILETISPMGRDYAEVHFDTLPKDTEVVIKFSKYVFDLIFSGSITSNSSVVPVDPSARVVIFVQNITTRKTYSLLLKSGETKTIYAVELGDYVVRVVTPMFHTATVTSSRLSSFNGHDFKLDKGFHAAEDGKSDFNVVLNKYHDQWINDSSTTW